MEVSTKIANGEFFDHRPAFAGHDSCAGDPFLCCRYAFAGHDNLYGG
jgi:hypothetical protein